MICQFIDSPTIQVVCCVCLLHLYSGWSWPIWPGGPKIVLKVRTKNIINGKSEIGSVFLSFGKEKKGLHFDSAPFVSCRMPSQILFSLRNWSRNSVFSPLISFKDIKLTCSVRCSDLSINKYYKPIQPTEMKMLLSVAVWFLQKAT